MAQPGFTAEASLGPTTHVYRVQGHYGIAEAADVHPQFDGEGLEQGIENSQGLEEGIENGIEAGEGLAEGFEEEESTEMGGEDAGVFDEA